MIWKNFQLVNNMNHLYKRSMFIDKELARDLVQTNKEIRKELTEIIESLQKDPSQLELYEQFGQIIDRIYGTVATIGMKNFAEYTKVIKQISYACSKSDSKQGRARVIGLLEGTIKNLVAFEEFITNPKKTDKLNTFKLILKQEKARADNLLNKTFSHIKNTGISTK